MKNPFEYKNPDAIPPTDIIDLFVPVFGEYYNIPLVGHTFINGARGSGKSMMFRYMMPDCQRLVDNKGNKLETPRAITDLEYFSIFLPIKKGHLNKTDIKLNGNHGDAILNEHYMVTHFSLIMFDELSKLDIEDNQSHLEKLKVFYNEIFVEELIYCGFEEENISCIEDDVKSIKDIFKLIIKTLKLINRQFQKDYISKLINTQDTIPYNGCILSYSDFLTEIIKAFRQLPFMPNDKPIFLLIDDADELSILQRKILNSWVAVRSTDVISLKISTQLKYKVFSTINGSRIDTPHDYSEINMNDIYTTKRDLYYERVKAVVEKRLSRYTNNEAVLAEDFFQEDLKQKEKIDKLFDELKAKEIEKGKSESQAYDYAYRYTTPIYITNLEGNRSTFSYSGFKQLVNISTGIMREFIDFSSDMFEEALMINGGDKVEFITSSIQNDRIRKYSEQKVVYEFDKYKDEEDNKVDMDKLRNLIHSMGELFKLILISNQSERRVFSIALNDEPSDELKKILDLGVSTGYLQKSMIGNKEGTGRARLYILNRALSPFFGLDPSSFAGYKFMNSSVLESALTNKKLFLSSFKKKLLVTEEDNIQETLKFEE